ncbi:hypothetical protein DSCOOX_53140 [Desulfosarcina ovata subsp. ovata]|uniref:Uncharacterized protein n=1 Tax=Desulfosarcina ovata subsp. ovata TaxID=2752305 RepID=A0A5K8AKE4_9BACT|nr:hypothetical protein DSCOOX_53140 [Desulfosarcina ovata subsp. ovata]
MLYIGHNTNFTDQTQTRPNDPSNRIIPKSNAIRGPSPATPHNGLQTVPTIDDRDVTGPSARDRFSANNP